ncbi:MAG: acetate--CoA ligase family protein [Sandaracinaceae bacterium]
MSLAWRIVCDDAELAVDGARVASRIGLAAEPALAEDALSEAIRALSVSDAPRPALLLARPPRPTDLARLAAAAGRARRTVPIGIVAEARASADTIQVAGDLGLPAVGEVAPLLALAGLLGAAARRPWLASTRALTPLERVRLADPSGPGRRSGGGRLGRAHDGLLTWSDKDTAEVVLGEPAPVGEALRALRAAAGATPPSRAVLEGVDRAATEEVLFGPPRALSDPASKAALDPYGLPLPLEELCTSPSRAAAEASRLGYPVRIALASPDLRLWDHPDLAVDGVASAAQVREVYRQSVALAAERAPEARVLGVTVTATIQADAWLRVWAEPMGDDRVLAGIGFADPHGRASEDATRTVLPANEETVDRVLGRLAGAPLLLGGPPARRRATVAAIADALLRLSAFVNDLRAEVRRVDLHPLVVLVGGAVEVREACVTVGDAYLRSLEAPAQRPG